MLPDPAVCHRAVAARDPRFDGWFFVAVTTTGIYCRPSCPAAPRPDHRRFFATAAAAQCAGYRACKRCRPDATPGSPEWSLRGDVVARAMRLIADGIVDREGVAGLAGRLGYSERHLNRRLLDEVGAGPIALARARRAQGARVLLETTDLHAAEVAFAAGFSSVRQFNDTIREVFALTPTALRARAARGRETLSLEAGGLTLRLAHRSPLALEELIAFLGTRAVEGVEELVDGAFRRSLRLPHGGGVAELRAGDGHVRCTLWLDDLRDAGVAAARCRALLDLDADPVAIAGVLGDDALLGPLVHAQPGRRIPGHVDGAELAVRAILGQQVSLAGAATLAGRLVRSHGEPLARPIGGVTHLFPSPASLADLDPASLAGPGARAHALRGLARALAEGELILDRGADRDEVARHLLALPGIGPWTASYIAMRGLGDPDAFLPTDLGVHHALDRLGADPRPGAVARMAERWRPFRAYAVAHLWASDVAGRSPLAVTGRRNQNQRVKAPPTETVAA